jgi:hypothetical protein
LLGKSGIKIQVWVPVFNRNIAKKAVERLDADHVEHFCSLRIGGWDVRVVYGGVDR